MVKITKIYTKTGDQGETGLAGQHRIAKTDPRVHAMGDIDELNAFIGWVLCAVPVDAIWKQLRDALTRMQHELFNLGAMLAVQPEDRRDNTPKIDHSHVTQLEQEIDALNAELASLKSFILPGGHELGSRLHCARAVCRRAERSLADVLHLADYGEALLPYLNRLSDWLFVAARWSLRQLGTTEVLWEA